MEFCAHLVSAILLSFPFWMSLSSDVIFKSFFYTLFIVRSTSNESRSFHSWRLVFRDIRFLVESPFPWPISQHWNCAVADDLYSFRWGFSVISNLCSTIGVYPFSQSWVSLCHLVEVQEICGPADGKSTHFVALHFMEQGCTCHSLKLL